MTLKPVSAAEAHRLRIQATRKRQSVTDCPDYSPTINRLHRLEADAMKAAADTFLTLTKPVVKGMGGELAPPPSRGLIGQELAVKQPDYVSMEASIERIAFADSCGAFNLAFDTAETIGAKDATEQMLAHQMAAAHKAALDLLAKSAQQRDTIEQARLANTAARLMDASQKAILTLNRIRSGGRQVVTVQHVQVADGGQALIAGAMHTGGQLARGGDEK